MSEFYSTVSCSQGKGLIIRTDNLLERNRKILSYDQARKQDIGNLQNWIKDKSCLAEEETAYLQAEQDLMAAISPSDDSLVHLERPLTRVMTGLYQMLGKASPHSPVPYHIIIHRSTAKMVD